MDLLKEVIYDQQLEYCNQCGECVSVCPVARLINFRPRRIAVTTQLEIIEELIKSDEILLCALCGKCHICSRNVTLPESFLQLRQLVSEAGYLPKLLDNFSKTFAILREEIPFPIVFSWLCLRPHEDENKRKKFDELVLEFLLQNSLKVHEEKAGSSPKKREEKVAVIGSGPAGLTAAWELVRSGFLVTVFETFDEAGGMLRVGIPEYRLPKKILDIEIGQVERFGVEIRTNHHIDENLFSSILNGDEYKAIFIATGAHRSGKLKIEGEGSEGVINALDLLRQTNLKHQQHTIGKRIVVIGGGNVAMDVARTALRLGAEKVHLTCLENREEMPAHEWEIQEALMEGVTIDPSWGPKKILGTGRRVTGVELMQCVSVFDQMGRFHPMFEEDRTKILEADIVILAIGQAPDLSFVGKQIELIGNTIAINPITMKTSHPKVFAGGDSVLGPASVIEAMVTGKRAAASISVFLNGLSRGNKEGRDD